jgi:hypothetical protein
MNEDKCGNFFRHCVTFVKGNIYPGVDGRIILRWIFGKWNVGVWIVSSLLWTGTDGGHLGMW